MQAAQLEAISSQQISWCSLQWEHAETKEEMLTTTKSCMHLNCHLAQKEPERAQHAKKPSSDNAFNAWDPAHHAALSHGVT